MSTLKNTIRDNKWACWLALACLVVPMFASYFFDDMFSSLSELFGKASGKKDLTVKETALKDGSVPAILNITEKSRRMNEMAQIYGMKDVHIPLDEILVLNTESPIVKKLKDDPESDLSQAVAKQLYLLAVLNQRPFTAEELNEFQSGCYDIISRIQ